MPCCKVAHLSQGLHWCLTCCKVAHLSQDLLALVPLLLQSCPLEPRLACIGGCLAAKLPTWAKTCLHWVANLSLWNLLQDHTCLVAAQSSYGFLELVKGVCFASKMWVQWTFGLEIMLWIPNICSGVGDKLPQRKLGDLLKGNIGRGVLLHLREDVCLCVCMCMCLHWYMCVCLCMYVCRW